MIKSGTILKGRYEIRDRIARGGFAVVYSAWDKTFERPVAVKVVDLAGDAEDDEDPKNGQELLREARFVASYRHPNVLDVYDFGDLDEQTFLVMPLADGGTLQQLLKAGPLTYEQADSYLQQVSAGLDHAHRLKVIHRDLKPQNLLLFGEDKKHLVISDFGVAKALSQTTVASARITGTPRYMAPEQFLGRASYSSDIYSLGIVLYQMLAGETPYKGDQAELLYGHTTVQPPLLSLKRPDAPPVLDQLIQKALAKDPNQRPKSAGELSHLFHQIVTIIQQGGPNINTISQTKDSDGREGEATISFTPSPNPYPSNPTPTPISGPVPPVTGPTPRPNLANTPPGRPIPSGGSFGTTPPPLLPVTSPPVLPPSGPVANAKQPSKVAVGVAVIGLLAVLIGLGVALSGGLGGQKLPAVTATTVPGIIINNTTTRPSFVLTTPAATSTTLDASTTLATTQTLANNTTSEATTPPNNTPRPTTPASLYVFPPAGDRNLTATIEIWTDSAQNPEEWNLLNNNIAAFNQSFPGVKVNVKQLGQNENIDQKFPAGVQTNSGPDLVIAPVGVTGDWASLKVIRPVSEVLPPPFLQTFEANAVAASTLGGLTYGMPYNYGNILVLYYNKKLTQKPPSTFDELLKQAQTLNKGDNVQGGLALNRYDFNWFLPFLNAFDGWPVDAAGQVTLNTDAMRNSLQYFKDLTDKKGVSPTLSYDNANALFNNGKLAYFINGDWELINYLKPEVQAKVDLGIAPLPPINGRTPRSMINPRQYFLSSQSSGDKLKAALYFLQFQGRPEQQKQLINVGLIPASREILNSPELRSRPYWQAIISQLPDSKVQPVYKNVRKVWEAINNGLNNILNGSISPYDAAAAMQDAATR